MQSIETALFSELIEHNSKIFAVLSPRGHAIASAVQSQLQIWNVNTKEVSNKFECDNGIDFIKWSPDSELICCGILKECIQVWNPDMPHWRCKIDGCLAFINIYWAPDCCHLLVVSEFYIKITIFSLVSSVAIEIDNPKAIDNGIVFSPCEKYLVIAQRINFEDYLIVYSCDTWEAIKTFIVETKDLASISFSPKDLAIAILESPTEYKVLFYSIDGRLLGKFTSEANFGLISLNWNKVKHYAAVADCFGEVKILDCLDFEIISSYKHPDLIETNDIIIYKVLESSEIKISQGEAFSTVFELDEVVKSRPVSLLPSILDTDKGKNKNLLKSGVQMIEFSSDGRYIASVNGNMPKIVFVYDVESLRLFNVTIRGSNIKNIHWHPEKPYLVICSTSNILDIWTPKNCIRFITSFSKDFLISHAMWSSTGDHILLNSRDHFSVVYFHNFQ